MALGVGRPADLTLVGAADVDGDGEPGYRLTRGVSGRDRQILALPDDVAGRSAGRKCERYGRGEWYVD